MNNNISDYELLVKVLTDKYGILLSSRQCAEALGISSRTLEERRKIGKDCPRYIESGRSYKFQVQEIVRFQLMKSVNLVEMV